MLEGNNEQHPLLRQSSAVELLAQQYQTSDSAPLGNPGPMHV